MHIQTKILSPKLFIDNTAFKMLGNTELTNKQNTAYRKIPKISPSVYKPPKPVTQKTLR